MKIGVAFPQTELDGNPEWGRRFCLAAEELGYDHLMAYDHVVGALHAEREPPLTGPYTEKHPFHDPFVLFAHLAGMTKRIEFVTGILILPQRQTVLVAKQAADLDLLSGERLRLGLGTGWNYVEYDALGQDYGSRGPRLTEQVDFLRRLWREPVVTFKGKFDSIERGCIVPRPKRQIPIWFGGRSDVAFRRAAAIGDGFIFPGRAIVLDQGLPRLKELLEKSGRESGFGLETVLRFWKTADELVGEIERWREKGMTHVTIVTMEHGFTHVDQHIDLIAHVRARLHRH